jgi:predicted CXXCH cytochrome family protein
MTILAWLLMCPGISSVQGQFSELDELQPPHNDSNSISCPSCHVPFGAEPDPVPPNWISDVVCKSCHIEGGPGRVVDYHVAPSYADTTYCTECHNPHIHQDSFPHYYLDQSINTPNSGRRSLAFRDSTDFVHGSDGVYSPYDGICETCHTLTNHHRNDGEAPVQDHHSEANCVVCHPHVDGFRPTSGECSDCHDHAQPEGNGEYRRIIADNLGTVGDFAKNSHHYYGSITSEDCTVCHNMQHHQSLSDPQVMLNNVDTGDTIRYTGDPQTLETFCIACHDANGANGDLSPFSDDMPVSDIGSYWAASAHQTGGSTNSGYTCVGDGIMTGCHGNGHGSQNIKLLNDSQIVDYSTFCFNCHTDAMVENHALSGSVDDIQEAFSQSVKHNIGSTFDIEGTTYELHCSTCHNPHIVTGRHWEVEQGLSPVTMPDLNADPALNPRAVGTELWGDEPGEKMDDFAAMGTGSGGWYYSVARGGQIVYDQPAVYQPPKSGSGYNFEYDGDVLPDYASFCLECHTNRVGTHPPVNWGQGVSCTGNGIDPPDQRVECGVQHGLSAAKKPSYWGDVGMYGTSGNPDPIFAEPSVTRGRGAGHFMRWPYESADRHAGINFVMSCTDCHESHGSAVSSMLRTTVNEGPGTSIWNTMCNNCHYYYGGHHAGMSCGTASCHEANSIHRIIHNTSSNGDFLWTEPSRPSVTSEIISVAGIVGSEELELVFETPVYSDSNQTGVLTPEDFVFTDVNNDNPRSIVSVDHNLGDSIAYITLSRPLILADINQDLIAANGISVWNSSNYPTGPWPSAISSCPEFGSVFEFNVPAGSATIVDDTGLITGIVNDPNGSLTGDDLFTGDGVDNYIDFTENSGCLKATTNLVMETRIRPSVVDFGEGSSVQRVFVKDGNNYQMSVWRSEGAEWTPTYQPPDSVASIAFWVRVADNHGGVNWKPILTDYDNYPIMSNHWYEIRVVWDSSIVGSNPGSIWIDDQGTNGDDADQLWVGFVDCTDNDQSQSPETRKFFEGDEILAGDGFMHIGATGNQTNLFNGLIEYVRVYN